MYKSLCNDDFYPLIENCTRWMSYEEKVAHRTKHSIPCSIDEWIEDEKTHTKGPIAGAYNLGTSGHKYTLLQDIVECILNVVTVNKEVSVYLFDLAVNTNFIICQGFSGSQSPDIFTLTLRVRVPQTTSFLMHYWHSPIIIVDQYIEDSCSKPSPRWLKTIRAEVHFWQSRILMLEMMLYFIQTIPLNSRVSRRVVSWCRAMSVSQIL